MADPSPVKRYAEREHIRFDHQREIKKERGYRGVRARWGGVRAVGGGQVAGDRGRPEGDLH